MKFAIFCWGGGGYWNFHEGNFEFIFINLIDSLLCLNFKYIFNIKTTPLDILPRYQPPKNAPSEKAGFPIAKKIWFL